MQDSVFKRELTKYRVVRREDHHKVRWKKLSESTTGTSSSGAAPSKSSLKKSNKRLQSNPTMNLDTVFWKDMQATAQSVLSAEEYKRFMAAFQKEYAGVIEKVNFEDLEAGLDGPL